MTVTYSDVQMPKPENPPWPGIGNINADPCFVDPGYWDSNGTPYPYWDDFWVGGDYHLRCDSPCIDSGGPVSVLLSDTDLDNKPRIVGGAVDMGAYEYQNTAPVADAGSDQTVYACIDNLVDVSLDGSTSCDDDNDVLTYRWLWNIDGNNCEANGVCPIITLPVGEHQIELVVDDGLETSQSDYCRIEVIAPLQAKLFCLPRALNTQSHNKAIIALLTMPDGISPDDIDPNERLLFYPGAVESKQQVVSQRRGYEKSCTFVLAVFDPDACMEYLSQGPNTITIVGKLKTGRCYYGTDSLHLFSSKWLKWLY